MTGKRSSSGLVVAVIVLVLSSLACSMVTPTAGSTQPPAGTPAAPGLPAATPGDAQSVIDAQEQLLEQLYARANPGVVNIQTDLGSGSGFVYDQEGHIITNNHVIDGAQAIEVVFADKTRTEAEVVGTDVDADVAVILVHDVPADKLVPLELGDSSQVKVGQQVIAIGNPFGLVGTMTLGIVSGLGRTLQSDRQAPGSTGGTYSNPDVIQTDAAINPGNSGGPLLDSHGRVIGINAAIRTDASVGGQPVNSGVGFAIPINTVKRIVPSLIATGHYDYPYLGISGFDGLTLDVQRELDLTQGTGVYVTTVVPDGPSDKAGLREGTEPTTLGTLKKGGDLIVGIDNQPVTDFADLIGYLVSEKSPGDQVVLHILRDGQPMDITVTLDKRP
jgi:S1-C subfamily serine protease